MTKRSTLKWALFLFCFSNYWVAIASGKYFWFTSINEFMMRLPLYDTWYLCEWGTFRMRPCTRSFFSSVRQKCEEQGMAGCIKNARNAGRKKKYSEETDRKVMEEYGHGKSIRKIAAETGCSTGYVQKLIYEHRYK